MTLHLDAEVLASHVIRQAATEKPYRPVGFKIDTDGIGLSVLLPGPAILANMLSLPGVDAYRDGVRLLTRPQGSDEAPEALSVLPLADALRAALSALPERSGAGEAYADLRLAASTSSPRFDAYLLDVVRAFVRRLPKVPMVAGPKAPAKSPKERARAYRARQRDAVRASAVWALTMFLTLDEDDEDPRIPPADGERVSGSALFEYASDLIDEVLAEYASAADEDDLADIRSEYPVTPPLDLARVSRQALYAVADDAGHKVTRPGRAVVLTIRKIGDRVRALLQLAADVMRDPRSPEERDRETFDRIGLPVEPARLDPAIAETASALPLPVAASMAADEDPRRALRLVGREWAERHPETRPAIVDAARAYGPDLVEAVRFRVASAVEADQ